MAHKSGDNEVYPDASETLPIEYCHRAPLASLLPPNYRPYVLTQHFIIDKSPVWSGVQKGESAFEDAVDIEDKSASSIGKPMILFQSVPPQVYGIDNLLSYV